MKQHTESVVRVELKKDDVVRRKYNAYHKNIQKMH